MIENLKYTLFYPYYLVKDIIFFKKYKKVIKNETQSLNEKRFKIDWIYRIYTVINIPEEFSKDDKIRDTYLIDKFKDFEEFFIKMGMNNILYPKNKRLSSRDELVSFYPYFKSFNFLRFLKFITIYTVLFFIVKYVISLWYM